MKVLLLQDLRHAGKRGTVIETKPGYARNYLLPQGLGVLATPGNLKWFDQQRRKIDARHVRERDVAVQAAGQLQDVKVKIAKRVGETETLYGSVTASDIVAALASKGIEIDRRRIDLGGGIKVLGDHSVRIDLHPEVVAEITVTVVSDES